MGGGTRSLDLHQVEVVGEAKKKKEKKNKRKMGIGGDPPTAQTLNQKRLVHRAY
jgi:hypothetical protein